MIEIYILSPNLNWKANSAPRAEIQLAVSKSKIDTSGEPVANKSNILEDLFSALIEAERYAIVIFQDKLANDFVPFAGRTAEMEILSLILNEL